MLTPYSMEKAELFKKISTDESKGLSVKEAKIRLEKNGENKLREKKKKTILQRFFDQFKDAMIVILIAAAVVSFAIAIYENNPSELFEPLLIILIVIVNATMGVLQESKAEKALEALQNLSAPKARVLRDGQQMVIDATELVVGDIIIVEAGDFVPADARLLTSASLKSEESALTGESVPSEKNADLIIKPDAPIGDRTNMIYSGCSITYGRATAVVTATGMDTEMGKIANLLEGEQDSQTPLQQRLADLGKSLGFLVLGVCAVIFAIGIIDRMPPLEIFMVSVSLAVSAIPEGLPAIVTIILSIGVQRMVKKNAIIRRLPAVETLGSATVICSDKTGTLTQNCMTLTKAFDAEFDLIEDISNNNSQPIKNLLKFAALCSDATIIFEDGEEKHIGDPTETAIVLAAHKNGMLKDELNNQYPRMAEIPFDSDRKLMTTVNKIDGKLYVIVKGAIDALAPKCVNGNITKGKRISEKLSADALRVIAVAYKEIDEVPQNSTSQALENELTFMGVVGMIDPPRPEVKNAVKICKRAGIKPVMITGDHVVTASAIAKELEILSDDEQAIKGIELSKMSDEELTNKVRDISVYARVSPNDKIRIVNAWKNQGEVVAMTGDGVNDAPALKAADIGCAMGITGTDVAKGASDMVLTDDNFATIVDAVKEGRGIYDNIKKVVGFLLGTNIGEVLTVFFGLLLWKISPLLPIQLLWINLVTDSLPAIGLGMEDVEKDVMSRKPKPKDESIFSGGLGYRIGLQGIIFSVLTLLCFNIGLKHTSGIGWGEEESIIAGRTMAFIVLALLQVVHSFNMRSVHSLFSTGPFTNKYLNSGAIVSTLLVILVIFIPPVADIFGLAQLPLYLYLIAFALSFTPVLLMEILKAINKHVVFF